MSPEPNEPSELTPASDTRRKSSSSAGAELASLAAPNPPSLIGLARRLQASLTPVEPRPQFIGDLGDQLASAWPQAEAEAAVRARQKERRLMWVAGLGGALYLAGLGLVSVRAAQAVASRFGALISTRSDDLTKAATPS